jgi:hypothetical protein
MVRILISTLLLLTSLNAKTEIIEKIQLGNFIKDKFYDKNPKQDKIFDYIEEKKTIKTKVNITSKIKHNLKFKRYMEKSSMNFIKKYIPNIEIYDEIFKYDNTKHLSDRDNVVYNIANYKIDLSIKDIYITRVKEGIYIKYEAMVVSTIKILDTVEGTYIVNDNISGFATENIKGKFVEKYTELVVERAIDNMFIKNYYLYLNAIGPNMYITDKYIQTGNHEFYLAKIKKSKITPFFKHGLKVNIYRNIFKTIPGGGYDKNSCGHKYGIDYIKTKIGMGIVSTIEDKDYFYVIIPREVKIRQKDYIKVVY